MPTKKKLLEKAKELQLDVPEKVSKKDLQALISNREQATDASEEASEDNTPEETESADVEQVKTTNTGHEDFVANIEGYSYGSAPDTDNTPAHLKAARQAEEE